MVLVTYHRTYSTASPMYHNEKKLYQRLWTGFLADSHPVFGLNSDG